MIYDGDKFPGWHGSVFSGALAGEQLARLHMTSDYQEVITEETLAYGMGRIRDVRQGPDGYIYIAISDGNGAGRGSFEETAIMRLEPVDR
jgi:glucose/arabinose dehydrogenase